MKSFSRRIAAAACSGSALISGCSSPTPVPDIRDESSDVLISSLVRSALQTEEPLGDYVILVETFHGTVLLSGLVDFAWQRTRAFDLTTEIDGVNHVLSDQIDVDGMCRHLSARNARRQD